jgi:carbon-monoxide dehydrogenase catalytic subunit
LVGEVDRGVCGAGIDTVVARNFARAVAAGAASHSDHARDLAYTLLAAAEGHAPDYQVRDPHKLFETARWLGVRVADRPIQEIARDVALAALGEFGRLDGHLAYLKRAPAKRQKIWQDLRIAPRAIDREVVEILHRTHAGNDQDAEHLLDQAMRCALADGWGGSMLATDLADILFGTPAPVRSEANLGVLQPDMVNVIIHGHEPTLSEMLVVAAQDPELLAYAQTKGAKGINLAGICCTANEVLIREGIPLAGNFLQQELAILTGAVEAMVVDVQCIMEGLSPLAQQFHTALITTSPRKFACPGRCIWSLTNTGRWKWPNRFFAQPSTASPNGAKCSSRISEPLWFRVFRTNTSTTPWAACIGDRSDRSMTPSWRAASGALWPTSAATTPGFATTKTIIISWPSS